MTITLTGNATILEEVTPDDAQLLCDLRNDPQRNRFLSSTATISIEDQKAWTKMNAAKKDNFYFKVLDKKSGDFCGTVAIYDKVGTKAEFGRYVCTKPLQAIESEFLILKFGFDVMYLDTIFCRTVKDNKNVWNQHYKYGFKDIREEVLGPRKMLHMIQELHKDEFSNFDYSFIDKLIDRLK